MKLQNCECIHIIKELVVDGNKLVVKSINSIDKKHKGKTVILKNFDEFYTGTIAEVDMQDPLLPFRVSYLSTENVMDQVWCGTKHVYVPINDSETLEDLIPEYFI